MTTSTVARLAAFTVLAAALATGGGLLAQTREKGPWWPSAHGPKDQAGNGNYITPEKVMKALRIPKTGQTYELGHIYEPEMPQYGNRPFYLITHVAPTPVKEGAGFAQQEYFTGYIGQMGTQYDGFGHQGRVVRMADGTLKNVYYNGFTQEDLTGRNRGIGGLEALGVEHVKPIITRGILIDIAGYKGVATLDSRYEVTIADVRGALAKQGIREESLEAGDAILFNYGWAVHWGNPQKYNDSRFFVGENQGSPGIGVEVARWAVARKASMVGADSCCVTIQPPVRPELGNVHHELLFGGVGMLENMDLRELARDRVYEFLYLNLTERIRGATGSPVRPIAIR
ncbi:MAG: cyclase family protein [Acidobacteria bacterium]|nr:cyclase family protein [Acidobacteriota bacterium]